VPTHGGRLLSLLVAAIAGGCRHDGRRQSAPAALPSGLALVPLPCRGPVRVCQAGSAGAVMALFVVLSRG